MGVKLNHQTTPGATSYGAKVLLARTTSSSTDVNIALGASSLFPVIIHVCTSPAAEGGVFPVEISKKWKLSFVIIDSYTYRFEGSHDLRIIDRPRHGSLRSPGFPLRSKVADPSVTYLIHGLSPRDCMTLIFCDYDICDSSVIIVYDGANRTAPKKALRHSNPYPHIKSSSQYLLVEYLPSPRPPHCTGFRAEYQYECAVVNVATGGAVYQEGSDSMDIDCVWPLHHEHLSMSLRFISSPSAITALDESTSLIEIREGSTSTGRVLFATRNIEEVLQREFTSTDGLYVRLRASYAEIEHVAFVFTPFRQLDEKRTGFGKDIPCDLYNGVVGFTCHASRRCVPTDVCCDGVQHCAGAEDEYLVRCQDSQFGLNDSSERADCFSWGLFWCDDGHNCFSADQRCDGEANCADNADELFCGSSAYLNDPKEKPKTVWWLAIPVGILCVVLLITLIVFWRKQRRGQMIYRCGIYTPHAHNIQMHTFHDDGMRAGEEGNLSEPLHPHHHQEDEEEEEEEEEEEVEDEICQDSPRQTRAAMETISTATLKDGLQLWGEGEPLML
ncbi:hypothetical protein CAPTEDRAFT_224533 [Capitella teleta]|uniref:CUB domain-containing protein n=1 Tax=Capitella teleta TaxID=283909 RepID=R7TTH5_CAPTE|nr:hypothetical protein CAPTEDRAFT_224533 [Capitella teleta]|eukprot:ELT96907.1 hypothetical protein CAPTEDRAFT_224533 [Capitella teleta]